jgi:hypothetical protein
MTMKAVREFIDRHIHKVVAIQIFIVIALWGASTILPPLQDWILQHSIFNILIIVLLNDILLSIVELKTSDSTFNVNVFQDEPEAYLDLRKYIDQKRPKKADLIEYSTATIHDLLETLKRFNCELRILICNPDSAVNDFQRDRINDRIRDLTTLTFLNYPAIEVRMYRLPASIRGRLFDQEYLTVGWHTHTAGPAGLYGHTNPMINVETKTPEGRMMLAMFASAFNELWSAPSTTVLLGPGAELNLASIKDAQTTKEIAMRLDLEQQLKD